MLILLLLNGILLFGIWRRLKPRKVTIRTKIEYYDGLTPEQFAEKELYDSCPELRYEILREQFERGEIHKVDYDNAIENLIKDITI
jgi:hypothetical protein